MSNFLVEFQKLRPKFPFVCNFANSNENSDFGDDIFRSKNCYYVFNSTEMEDSLYCEDGFKETSDVDCRFGINCSLNCECVDFADSTNCYHSNSFARCYNIWYSWYLDDCHDCFGCANLDNKSYCIFNEQHTKEEYEKKLPELKKMPKAEVQKKINELKSQLPQMNGEYVSTENSDYCDYAYYMTNCYYCFDCAHDEDCGYLTTTYESKDSWDCTYVVRGERNLNCSNSGDIYNCYEVSNSDRCYDSYYLEDCSDCHDCFGCTKLAHKQYCILNVQYTKEEYEKKVAGLRKELGLRYQA